MPERILITGVSGFIGSALCEAFPGTFGVEGPAGKRAPLDLRKSEEVLRCIRHFTPDVVIHSAAVSKSAQAEKEPELAYVVNVLGTENLLRAVESVTPHARFLFLSTDLVFEGATPQEGGFCEQDSPTPVTVYAKSKLEAEGKVLSSSVQGTIFRLPLVASPRGGFLAAMLRDVEVGKPMTLFSDEWRAPLCIEDVSRALRTYLTRPTNKRCYHLSGGEVLSRTEMGERLIEALGRGKIEVKSRTDFPGYRPERAVLDDDLFRADYGFQGERFSSYIARWLQKES